MPRDSPSGSPATPRHAIPIPDSLACLVTNVRCRDDGVECVVRPRANAAILVDDLRWQQSVEMRLQNLQQEIAAVRAANAELQRQVGGESPRFADEIKHERERERERRDAREAREYHDDSHIRKRHRSSSPIHEHGHGHARRESAPRFVLPSHLHGLREILQPALNELQRPDPLDVSIDDATILWES